MKNFLLSMLTLLGATSVWAQSFSGPDTRVVPQRTNVLQVTLTGANANRDLQFDLTLPPGISLVEDAGTVMDVAAGHVVQYHQAQAGGPIRFVVVDALVEEGDPAATSADAETYGKQFSDGVLVEIPVRAAEGFDATAETPAKANVTNLYISKEDGTEFSKTPLSFDINLIMNLLGDVNEDGDVDVTDIMAVANRIQKVETSPFNEGAADITNEGDIDVTDIMGIANIIQGIGNAKVYRMELNIEDTLDPQ